MSEVENAAAPGGDDDPEKCKCSCVYSKIMG